MLCHLFISTAHVSIKALEINSNCIITEYAFTGLQTKQACMNYLK